MSERNSATAATNSTTISTAETASWATWNRSRRPVSHELGVVVQAVAATKEIAEQVCMTGTRQMFYARLPGVLGSAGGVAFVLDEVLPASPACKWTINHTMVADDPLELFPVEVVEVAQLTEATV